MQPPLHVTSYPPPLKATVAVLGALSAAAALFCLATLALFRTHHRVKYTQPPVLFLIFSGYLVLSVKIMASVSTINARYCVADKWVGHVGFACAFIPLVVKLWRLDKIVNGKTLKKVKITDTDALKLCLWGMLALVILLAIDSAVANGVDPLGFMRSRRALMRNQYTYTYFCGLSHHPASLALTGFIYAFQLAVMAVAMVYLWKTRQLPANVNEVGTITPMVLAVTLLVVVTAALVGIVDFDPHTSSLIVNLSCAAGILLSINYYWAPKCSAIFWDVYKKKVASGDEEAAVAVPIKADAKSLDKAVQKTELLQKLRQHQLPPPKDPFQEGIVTELVNLKGSNLKSIFCQTQISYLQSLLFALSEMSDSSNNSSSKYSESKYSEFVSTNTAEIKTDEDIMAAPLSERDKPNSSFAAEEYVDQA